jgi:hypothetical protein
VQGGQRATGNRQRATINTFHVGISLQQQIRSSQVYEHLNYDLILVEITSRLIVLKLLHLQTNRRPFQVIAFC